MTKVSKWLGLAAAAVVMIAGTLAAGSGAVQAQPENPARFVGTVRVDGAYVSAGTVVEARVNGQVCGVAQTFNSGGEARYVVDVEASQPDGNPNCGTDGASVTFYIGGKMAQETGTWHNYQLNVLNLTYITPTATPTATTVPSTTATATATKSATPKPPSTGQGTGGGTDAGVVTLAVVLLGLGAVAFGMGGLTAAKRSR